MNLIHEQLQKLWLLGDKAAELANPALDAMKALAEQPAQQESVNKYCCHLCFNKSGQVFLDRMILCPKCGNKRCPKATHHGLPCTKSNDLGQKGSIYDQPLQQEPVAWVEGEEIYWNNAPDLNDWIRQNGQPLYTSPPAQRTWVGLTDEEIDELRSGYQSGRIGSFVALARAIEAKLKEKNT